MRLSPSAVAPILLAAAAPRSVGALFEDEVGSSDFLLATAGHGVRGVTYSSLASDGGAVITSSSHAYPVVSDAAEENGDGDGAESDPFGFASSSGAQSSAAGCYVSARSVEDGSLLWRRDACSSGGASSSAGIRHAVAVSAAAKAVYTLDDSGVLRGWDETTGALKFDVGLSGGQGGYSPSTGTPRLFGLDLQQASGSSRSIIGAVASVVDSDSDNEVLSFRASETGDAFAGDEIASIKAAEALGEAKVKQPKSGSAARILGLVPLAGPDKAAVLVGWIYADADGRSIASGSSMAFVDVTVTSAASYEVGPSRPVKIGGDGSRLASVPLKASSLRAFSLAGKTHLMGIAANVEDVITISTDHGGSAAGARRTGLTELHPLWTSMTSIHPPTNTDGAAVGGYDGYVTVAGDDDRYPTVRRTAALYRFDPTAGKIGKQLYEGPTYNQGEEETEDDAMVRCADVKMTFEYDDETERTAVHAYKIKGEEVVSALAVSGDAGAALPAGGPLRTDDVVVLKCSATGASILATATGGTTLYLSAAFKSDRVALNLKWSAEEALGAVSSATFLDETHLPTPSASASEDDEEEALLRGLTFTSRLASQVESLKSFLAGGVTSHFTSVLFSSGDESKSREIAFGFSKVAVLLNSAQHVLLGSDMGASSKGALRWTKRLHPDAAWHRVVHGGPSGRSGTNGGFRDAHASHGHEILMLSYVPPASQERGYNGGKSEEGAGTLRWTCLDGLSGRVLHSDSKIALTSRVAQIVPLHAAHHHGGGECRQMAAVLHEDDSVTTVPNTDHGREVLGDVLETAGGGGGGNGLYVHTLNRSSGTFRSLRIESADERSKATPVGEAAFNPARERVVSVAYPKRNEVVQSPATIIGDDSLLLKYLNPHLCVVVTEATPEFLAGLDKEGGADNAGGGFYEALGAEGKGSTADASKTKPLGATNPGEESPSSPAPAVKQPAPSLFINVVDAVSGRVLHRASHSHVPDIGTAAAPPPVSDVPVLISENWIVYAFPNGRTQRTELGVLTLHEGMIDKTGITMMTSPDQDTAFSSLTSPRPIVLAKTYGLQTPVTALGVTTTRGGISNKQVLAATGPGGSVASIDRRMLDPRRPTGEPKLSEKTEGLVKYFPLLSLTPKAMPTYTLEVSGVRSIESAAAMVESQSLTLAFGGPDVFFARLSPSRGFDLLPDSFNRPLLSAVVVGLVAVVVTLNKMSKKKMVAVGWT